MLSIWGRLRRKLFSPAPRRKSPQTPRYAKPSLETLENRLTPSVTVANAGNDLMITGDDTNNSIQVQVQPQFQSVNVVGLNGTQVQFANGFNPAAFNGVVKIDMGKGDDQVTVLNSNVQGVEVNAGDGNNTVIIHDVGANQLSVTGGAGNNTVQMFNDGFSSLTVNGGAGQNNVDIHNVGGDFINVNGGDANDTIQIANAGFKSLSVNGGAGDDQVNIHDVGGDVVNVNGGDGNDNVILRNDKVGALNLDGGAGDSDNLDLDSSVEFGSKNETGFENHGPSQGGG